MAEEKEEVQVEEEEVQQEERTFKQSEIDAMMSRRDSKVTKANLRELGFESLEEATAFIKAGREKQAAEMTEAEKQKAENEILTGKLTATETRAIRAETRGAALELGARTDRLDDILKLLPEGDEPIKDRLKTFLNERPEYIKKSGKNFSEESKDQKIPEADAIKERLRKSMGL